MTPAQVAAVVDRACTRKLQYRSWGHATKVAARVSAARGEPIRSYRCPFAGRARHWHIGHVPSMETVERLAEAIRARAQGMAA